MKTAAKITGFLMMLSFLAFNWLSHTGIMPGSALGHFLGGTGIFILAVCGFIFLTYNGGKTVDTLCFVYFLLLVINALLYTFLKSAGLIGPYFYGTNLSVNDASVFMVFLGIFYFILAALGAYFMKEIIEHPS